MSLLFLSLITHQSLAISLDSYDAFLKAQDTTHCPLKTTLRDIHADAMDGLSDAKIAQQETRLLKSKERASLFCSLLCAYRLVDVISLLGPCGTSLQVPLHRKIAMDFTKYEVSFSSPQ